MAPLHDDLIIADNGFLRAILCPPQLLVLADSEGVKRCDESRIDLTSVLEGCGGAASNGETDAAVLGWCGHCRERSLSHRTQRIEHQTVRASVLTNKQRHKYIYCGGCQNTSNTAPSSKLEVVTLALEDCAEKRSPRCDVGTVPVAMATASDAPRSYWSGSQPGSSPSHSNVRRPEHADTEVVSIRL
ncbi:hypothetical protein J6590_011784 [Homalodisca vitripennis]|nr:hypothetical protein J6590_011784 [Homalodisca vitripennis]